MADALPRQSDGVLAMLTREQADALFNLAAALDEFLPEAHPVRRAADKLDEQIAAQMRDPYVLAEDVLRDRLSSLPEWEYDRLHFDVLARAVVDGILGAYE
jgi:hypothetical protein